MLAKDLMTPQVVTVAPDMVASEIARLMSKHGISGLPVVDADGAPIGMVSEGDLIGRTNFDREGRRDWWLTLFSETPLLSADSILALAKLFAKLRIRERRASEIMSAPIVTVSETTEVREIAELLTAHRIKRVPVLRDGKIAGIVSRANLVRAMAAERLECAGDLRRSNPIANWFEKIDQRFAQLRPRPDRSAAVPESSASSPALRQPGADATEFRKLAAEFESGEAQRRGAEHSARAKLRSERMKVLIGEHVTEQRWHEMLSAAREAASHGMSEFMLLRFPHELCSDGGRAINALADDESWPETLRGEAAEIYLRWKQDLRPHGFRLGARVLEFPGGLPGDIGLFLEWGE
ncbi:MAG: CBS domain-containing protein [Methylocapsa sp.]|nr:CBS domain-containing protein [Methylocapsa sp.]